MLKMTFDGDKVAVTIILTKEANDEALAFLKDPQAFFSLDGNNQRKVLNKDSISGIYGLTVDSKDAHPLNDKALAKEIVDSTVHSMEMLTKYTLDDWDEVKRKVIPSQFSIESECTYPIYGTPTKTTLGRAVFFKVICEPLNLPFVNKPLTKKGQDQILTTADELVLEKLRLGDKDFFTEQFIPWLNKWEEFNFVIADLYSPSIDMDVYATSEEYDIFRENIINENKEKIENGDIMTYDDIETKMINELKETHKKEGVDTRIFDSGSKLSYNDDLRNGLVSVGPMPIGVGAGKFKISTSGLSYGTKKSERATYSQSNIVAGYFRAMGPATGGTIAKEILGASHNIKYGPKGSDCGRKVGQVYEVDDYFVEHLHLRYMIKPGGDLEQLTKQTLKEKYFGKRITVRAAHFCGRKGDPCNVCAGDRPYVVAASADTINVGAQKSRTGEEITQTSLSKFHESKTTFAYVDFNDYILFSGIDIKESYINLIDEMNTFAYSISEGLDSDVLLDDALTFLDEIIDDVVSDMPQEFMEFADEEHIDDLSFVGDMATSNDIDELAKFMACKAIDMDNLKNIIKDNTDMKLISNYGSSFENWFDGISQFSRNTQMMIQALNNERFEYAPIYMYEVSEEHEWFKFCCVLTAVEDSYTADNTLETICARVMEEAKLLIGELFDIAIILSDGVWYITAEYKKIIPWYLIPDYKLFKMSEEDRLRSSEEQDVSEAASDITKGRDEIASLERKMRSKTETQIKQIINMYSSQKKKARANITSSMSDKAAKLEVQLRTDKEAYRKHLQQMLVDFEANYIKANKFKLFKLKNKLNFIYNKKSSAIEAAMTEAIKHLQRKNRERLKASVIELREKYKMK